MLAGCESGLPLTVFGRRHLYAHEFEMLLAFCYSKITKCPGGISVDFSPISLVMQGLGRSPERCPGAQVYRPRQPMREPRPC